MDDILRTVVLDKLCQLLITHKIRWKRQPHGLAMAGVELGIAINDEGSIDIWRTSCHSSYSSSMPYIKLLDAVPLCDRGCFEMAVASIQRHAVIAPDARTAAKELRFELSKLDVPPTVAVDDKNRLIVKKWPSHKKFPFNISTGWHGYTVCIEHK